MVGVKYVNMTVHEIYTVHNPVAFVDYWNPYLQWQVNATNNVNVTWMSIVKKWMLHGSSDALPV
jgi:hypothetical protein